MAPEVDNAAIKTAHEAKIGEIKLGDKRTVDTRRFAFTNAWEPLGTRCGDKCTYEKLKAFIAE